MLGGRGWEGLLLVVCGRPSSMPSCLPGLRCRPGQPRPVGSGPLSFSKVFFLHTPRARARRGAKD